MLVNNTETDYIKFLNDNGINFCTSEKKTTVGATDGSTTTSTNTVIDVKTNRPRIEIDKNCPKDSFKVICDLIRKQLVTYDEAWALLLDIMPKEKEYVKEYIPSKPFYVPDFTYPPYNPLEFLYGNSPSISCVNSDTHEVSNNSTLVDKNKRNYPL